jgi:hypothetical protein
VGRASATAPDTPLACRARTDTRAGAVQSEALQLVPAVPRSPAGAPEKQLKALQGHLTKLSARSDKARGQARRRLKVLERRTRVKVERTMRALEPKVRQAVSRRMPPRQGGQHEKEDPAAVAEIVGDHSITSAARASTAGMARPSAGYFADSSSPCTVPNALSLNHQRAVGVAGTNAECDGAADRPGEVGASRAPRRPTANGSTYRLGARTRSGCPASSPSRSRRSNSRSCLRPPSTDNRRACTSCLPPWT